MAIEKFSPETSAITVQKVETPPTVPTEMVKSDGEISNTNTLEINLDEEEEEESPQIQETDEESTTDKVKTISKSEI